MDRLRLIECVLCDDCITIYRAHHDVMEREQLDARTSDVRELNLYEVVAAKFNAVAFVPFSSRYPKLHLDFMETKELKKGEVHMTPEKVKNFLNLCKPALMKTVVKYEKSGNGCMSRRDDSEEGDNCWGRFDIALCDGEIDDRAGYVDADSSYLLYFWQRMDEENLVSFACAKLPDGSGANSTKHAPVSGKKGNGVVQNDTMSTNIGKVGDGIHVMASNEMQRQIIELEDKVFELEMKRLDYDADLQANSITTVDKRISSLKSNIQILKKRKTTNDN